MFFCNKGLKEQNYLFNSTVDPNLWPVVYEFNCLFSFTLTDLLFQDMNEDSATPKEEKQERLSRHKETVQRSQAEEEAQLLNQQRLVYERSCRALKRRSLIKKHEFEQEQMREASHNINVWKL